MTPDIERERLTDADIDSALRMIWHAAYGNNFASFTEWERAIYRSASLTRAALPAATPDDARDALRFRWLAQHLAINSDGPGEWTCWLDLACIPYRHDPKDADPIAMLDQLMHRWPLAAMREAGK